MRLGRDQIWEHIHAERRALAAILATLSPDDWTAQSLCTGWTVKDVAAHIIMNVEFGLRDSLRVATKFRGSYAKIVFDETIRQSEARPIAKILDDFERLDCSRRKAFGVPVGFPLVEILVHAQDLLQPLGRQHAMPPVAAACAADVLRPLDRIISVRPVRGVRLVATDVEWSAGKGPVVEGPMQQLLLGLAGRPVAFDQLAGEGVARFA
jgi:uncharacterized protein (TIGR03083 family)